MRRVVFTHAIRRIFGISVVSEEFPQLIRPRYSEATNLTAGRWRIFLALLAAQIEVSAHGRQSAIFESLSIGDILSVIKDGATKSEQDLNNHRED